MRKHDGFRIREGIHGQFFKLGFESNVFVGTAVVDMYAKCGRVDVARQMFDLMPVRNIISWTAMVAGYAQNGQAEEATRFINQIHQEGMKPNELTFVSVVNACAILMDLKFGKQVHAYSIRSGFQCQVSVCNGIVTMYANCQTTEYALFMFDKMQERDLISWNAMIAAYAHNGHCEEALKLSYQMKQMGVKLNQFTCILSVSSNLPAFEEGYVQYGYGEEALKIFFQLQHSGLESDEATFASIVSACANLVVMEHGRHIHAHIYSSDLLHVA